MNAILRPRLAQVKSSLAEFFTAPASPRPLAVLRMGVTGVLLLQAFWLAPDRQDLFGSRGVIQWELSSPLVHPAAPRLAWVVDALASWGVAESSCLGGIFAAYVLSLAVLFVGYRVRVAATVAWLLHWMLRTSATASVYGVDSFAHMTLFYFLWMPIGDTLSLDAWLRGLPEQPTSRARLALRVLQLHLCVVYFAAGFEKALGPDWWDGEAIWCSLMRPDLCSLPMGWLADVHWLATVSAWGTLLVEMGYAVFVWPRRTRLPWALATLAMHAGIAVMLGLVSFAALMSVLTFAAFVVPSEPVTATRESGKGDMLLVVG